MQAPRFAHAVPTIDPALHNYIPTVYIYII